MGSELFQSWKLLGSVVRDLYSVAYFYSSTWKLQQVCCLPAIDGWMIGIDVSRNRVVCSFTVNPEAVDFD
jgi:hypothetical protein